MKNIFIVILALVSSSAFAGTKEDLQKIGDAAGVANGGWEVKSYDLNNFDVEKLMAKDLATVKKTYDSGGVKCGPYKLTKDRRETIKVVASGIPSDPETADKLMELYNQKKILKAYSISTRTDIDCSRTWVEVFTTDGLQLEIYYGMND